MVGIGGAGKTTILYKLHLGEIVTTIPSIGFTVESVDHKTLSFAVWDESRNIAFPSLYRPYFDSACGIIFVVDSGDRDIIEEAKMRLHSRILSKVSPDVNLLVLANKQDLPNAMTVEEVTERLGLDGISDRKWLVRGTSGNSGDGIVESINWLLESIGEPLIQKRRLIFC